ncbi:MAG TPA: hypothetical protein VMF03_14660 [Steroidobacteraceae bacterium]|nr:hypothetical protein [Steroidobacteraceae bacterium]
MSRPLRALAVLALAALAACAAGPPAQPPAGAATPARGQSPAQLLAVVQRDADGLDQTTDAAARSRLLTEAAAAARQCMAQFPDAGACPYAQAQVQGLSARAKPVEAPGLLKQMVASLARAEAREPDLDHAGPARLSAIVLLRAPPWPLGPGDVDTALSAAQRAVKLDPAYPPNLITLGAVQAKAVGAATARTTFGQARQAVQAWNGAGSEPAAEVAAERGKWLAQIEQGLHDLQ